MTRILLNVGAALLISLMLLVGVMTLVGTLLPSRAAQIGLARCGAIICWMQLTTQDAKFDEAMEVLEALGYYTTNEINWTAPRNSGLCEVAMSKLEPDRIFSLQLFNCTNLRLGDIFELLGIPDIIANDCFNNWVMWYDSSVAVFSSGELLPTNPVTQIAFYPPPVEGIVPVGVTWHGFAPQWRYNQLEGNIRGC